MIGVSQIVGSTRFAHLDTPNVVIGYVAYCVLVGLISAACVGVAPLWISSTRSMANRPRLRLLPAPVARIIGSVVVGVLVLATHAGEPTTEYAAAIGAWVGVGGYCRPVLGGAATSRTARGVMAWVGRYGG